MELIIIPVIIAAVVLWFRSPLKTLARIQKLSTVLVFIVLVVGMGEIIWVKNMTPTSRQVWQPKLDVACAILWFGATIPWLLFTVFQFIMVLKHKGRKDGL